MQLVKKRSIFYTILQAAMWPLWRERSPDRPALPPSALYLSLSRLSMGRFLDCLCDDHLGSLIISGQPTECELNQAWFSLLGEYHEQKGEAKGNETFMLSKEVNRLHNHLFLVGECLKFLVKRYSESVANSLTRLGYPFKPENKNPWTYIKLLEEITAKSKTKYVRLQQVIKELEEKMKDTTHEKPTREYYEELLLEFENMQHVGYNMEEIMTSKFLALEKKYWRMVDKILNKHGK